MLSRRSSATRVSGPSFIIFGRIANAHIATKQTRIVKKTVPTESFFNFFSPPKAPTEDDDDAASDIEERLELDYQLGEDIKEKLIPRAIDWFTGEALAFEELDEDDLEGFDDEDDEDDDDISEDQDDEEESEDDDVGPSRNSRIVSDHLTNRRRRMAPSPSRRLPSASRAKQLRHQYSTYSPFLVTRNGYPFTQLLRTSLLLVHLT